MSLDRRIEAVHRLQAVLRDVAQVQRNGEARQRAQGLVDAPSLREVLVGVLGPVGAGKTTLVARLAGVEDLRSGATITTRIPTLVLPGTAGEVRLVPVDGGEATTDDPFQESVKPDAAERWQRLEVEYRPARFPALAFFDLPGLGLSGAGHFGERYEFLARCDLLLLCWPATLPLAIEDAAALSGAVAPQARRVVALTRADLVEPNEIVEIVGHLRSVAGLGEEIPIIPVGGLSRARNGARRSPGLETLELTLRQVALEQVILPAAKAVANALLTMVDRPLRVTTAHTKRLDQALRVLYQEHEAMLEEGGDRIRDLTRVVAGHVAQATSLEDVVVWLEQGLKVGQAELVAWATHRLEEVERQVGDLIGQVEARKQLEMADAKAVLSSVNSRGVGGGARVAGTRVDVDHVVPWLIGVASVVMPGLGAAALVGSAVGAWLSRRNRIAETRNQALRLLDDVVRPEFFKALAGALDQAFQRWQVVVLEALKAEMETTPATAVLEVKRADAKRLLALLADLETGRPVDTRPAGAAAASGSGRRRPRKRKP
jgi:energy-coupling factor transporter ATP-binding protein EcfA2